MWLLSYGLRGTNFDPPGIARPEIRVATVFPACHNERYARLIDRQRAEMFDARFISFSAVAKWYVPD